MITSTACQGRTYRKGVLIDCGRIEIGKTAKLDEDSVTATCETKVRCSDCRYTDSRGEDACARNGDDSTCVITGLVARHLCDALQSDVFGRSIINQSSASVILTPRTTTDTKTTTGYLCQDYTAVPRRCSSDRGRVEVRHVPVATHRTKRTCVWEQ